METEISFEEKLLFMNTKLEAKVKNDTYYYYKKLLLFNNYYYFNLEPNSLEFFSIIFYVYIYILSSYSPSGNFNCISISIVSRSSKQ